jgi:hypothetical protein
MTAGAVSFQNRLDIPLEIDFSGALSAQRTAEHCCVEESYGKTTEHGYPSGFPAGDTDTPAGLALGEIPGARLELFYMKCYS